MTAAVVVASYTQDDLDADIAIIGKNIESVVGRIARIKENWPQVQHLWPSITAVEYIRTAVPWLAKNTTAAVALVEAGTLTVSDAARVTGTSRPRLSAKVSVPSGTDSESLRAKGFSEAAIERAEARKATTLAGKTAPGPTIGTKKVAVKGTPTLNVPAITGLSQPAPMPPSPLAADAYRLLKQVAELDVSAIRMAITAHQHSRLKKVAVRAEKVCADLGIPMITFP